MIEIREKDETISWEAITELLHKAYKKRLDDGLHYAAACQTVEDTKKRAFSQNAKKDVTLVAVDNNRLIGTITGHISHEGVLFLEMLGVHPDYQKKGIGANLLASIEKIGVLEKCKYVTFDTACNAKGLIEYYLRKGYYKTRLISWPTTNYYSIVFEKVLCGSKKSNWKYPFYVINTIVRFRQDGKKRF